MADVAEVRGKPIELEMYIGGNAKEKLTMATIVFYTERNGIPKLSCKQPNDIQEAITFKLQYLNEGGANIVFRFSHEATALPDRLRGRLLRLRKNLPHTRPAYEQLEAFNRNFRPLFPPQNVIHHELIELDDRLPLLLNEQLSRVSRPGKRRNDFLPAHERHGLLVTDMTPRNDETLLQFKPKWLAQSPNAPPNSTRCRTCALRAQRASRQMTTATDAQATCPLALISERLEDRHRAAATITSDPQLQAYLVNQAQPLLRTLKHHQTHLDPYGALNVSVSDAASVQKVQNLCKAMTLRDCTLFVIKRCGDGDGQDVIEARLGDLDFKVPEKLGKWRQVEEGLGREGWYGDGEVYEGDEGGGVCLRVRGGGLRMFEMR